MWCINKFHLLMKFHKLCLQFHTVRKDQDEDSTLCNHSSTRSFQAAKLRFLFVGHRVTQQPYQWNLTQMMVKQSQKNSRTGGSQNLLRTARKLKEIEANAGIEVSEIRRPDCAYLPKSLQLTSLSTRSGPQSLWREAFPLDFEMEEKKSMDREKYDFFTCTNALNHCHI